MPYQTTTLAQLRTALAERNEQQPFWTPDQARRAINEGLRIYNLITGMYRQSTTLALTVNSSHLIVGGALVKGTRVRITGSLVPLTLTSIAALDRLFPNWMNLTTASGGDVPTTPRYWCPVGLTEIQIYPAIDATLAGMSLDISGVRSTPLLVNDADYLNMGDEEISSLLGYALHVLTFAKGIEALQRTMPLRMAFFKACAMRNATFAASSLYRKLIGYDRTRSTQPMVSTDAMQNAAGALGSGAGADEQDAQGEAQ